ncbi:unnamed protein product [Absidia cylindrospora]
MNLRRRHNNHGNIDGKGNQLDTSTTTISAGTGVGDNNDTLWDGDGDDDLLPDDFEIVRANITGITRAMQAFHVRELFWDEATANMKETKMKHKRHHTAPDQHVAHNAWTTTTTTGLTHGVTHDSNNNNNNSNLIALHHHQPCIYLQTEQDLAIQQRRYDEKENSTLLTKSMFNTLSSSELAEKEASIQPLWHPTDLLTDAPTTTLYNNSLAPPPQQQQQQQQSWMTIDDDHLEDDDDAWRRQFMGLMASLVKQSEYLEYLSTELLSAESHVRSLLSLASTVQDQFYEREKQYQDRLRECDVAGQQQSFMLASLDELMADLDMKSPTTTTTTTTVPPEESKQRPPSPPPPPPPSQPFLLSRWYGHLQKRWETTLTSLENDTFVYKTRWRAGMLLNADVGTGDMIHVFQHPAGGIEMVIAGFGIIMGNTLSDQESASCTVPSSSQQDNLILHQYQVHLSPKDRRTIFVLLPKNRWMPDLFVDQCQLDDQVVRCSTRFTLFQRKHHCRRCGKIICQRHSGNRLPLFKVDHVDQEKSCKWYRICDTCFIQAISSVSAR